jgi:hypothetical protein
MQPGVRYRLVVRRGPQPNQQYDLSRDTMTIGRDITNDIVINDPEVSRHHARLVRTGAGYLLEDLRSTNGTFVNRHRLTTPHQLSNGDQVGLGETVIIAYEVIGAAGEATVVGGAVGYQQPPIQQPAPYSPPPVAPPPAYVPAEAPYEAPAVEERADDRNRWIIIGCAGLTLIFCCVLVIAAVVIDSQNLYCEIPVMQNMSFFCAP